MKIALKTAGVIMNLLCIVAGIWTSAVTLFELKFYPILFIPGMSTAESLYFNLIMFVLGIAALMFIIPVFSDKKPEEVVFPTIHAILPAIIGIIGIISAFSLTTTREKIIVILSSILYFLLSGTVIYNGAKIFQINK
ncbi:MAG: hypothetical protein IJR70_05610 [Eubacterium sp.]|nr:hypothetical protein [Eubacterium sp.]